MTRQAIEALAAALSHPSLFDEGVEAARNACVAGAPLAAAAITSAAYYGNPLTGAPAVLACMERVVRAKLSVCAWQSALAPAPHPTTGDPGFVPGFGFVTQAQGAALLRAGEQLLHILRGARLTFVCANHMALEHTLGPLNHAGLCALVFADLGMSADAAERAYLIVRMDPALAAAQQARAAGLRQFPFFENSYVYGGSWPSPRSASEAAALDLSDLAREVGLEL